MRTDALSILATIALFIVGLWVFISLAGLLFDLLGLLLMAVAVIWLVRWIGSRGA